MEQLFIHIKNKAPNGYKEFTEHVKTEFGSFMEFHKLSLDTMPRTFGIGLFFHFFEAQNIDFSIQDIDAKLLFDEILKTFEEYEKVISHYS